MYIFLYVCIWESVNFPLGLYNILILRFIDMTELNPDLAPQFVLMGYLPIIFEFVSFTAVF